MDSPPKLKVDDTHEMTIITDVTGVSRSGRVRKKSSKLTDFESPDEIDTRFKRKVERPPKSPQKMIKLVHTMAGDMYDDSDSYLDDDLLEMKDDDWGDDDDDDMGEDDNDGGDLGSESLHVDEDSTDAPKETSNYSQAHSVYLSEKQGKKNIVVKDGQVVQRKKAQRKDKGKSRFTAYMLWAREIRPSIIQGNQNMDFSAVNKRLGELWALVPTTQKYNWKRRAKRLAAKGNQRGSMITTGKAAKQQQNANRSNLINKGGVKPQQAIRSQAKNADAVPVVGGSTPKVSVSTPKTSRNAGSSATDHSPNSAYKVTGRTPIDVAAHIKLLGESLNNIGQKLKEHEGGDMYDDSDSYLDDDLLEIKDEPLDLDDWGNNNDDDNDSGDLGSESLHVDADSTNAPKESSNFSQAHSLYLSEKQGKKNIVVKDGQVVQRKKAQCNDKGKPRFTSSLLWAKEIRPSIIQGNQNMDFSAVNKRLGELWALIPNTQKYNLKRRAKRLAAKGNQSGSMISTGKAAKQQQNANRSNLINKGGVKPQQVIRSQAKNTNGVPAVGESTP